MNERVLFIDDDPELVDLAQIWLRKGGYDACTAKDGNEGLHQLYCYRPDLVLLDVVMPRMDGWEVCRRIREMCEIPIIMVSVNAQKSDLVKAFNLGVDDYVTKPIHFPELMARVQAVLRRHNTNGKQDEKAVFHNEEIDLEWRSRQVWVRGQRVALSPTEFRLLSCLIENRGWVVTHEELLRKVWGPNYLGDRSYVKLYVRYLREKMEAEPSKPRWILTERGVGYRFASSSDRCPSLES